MKKLIFSIIILISFTTVNGQNAKVDAAGNYIALKSTTGAGEGNKPTGKTFTDTKGNKYPVMVSAKGKLFYTRVSKTGNEYKVYIKI